MCEEFAVEIIEGVINRLLAQIIRLEKENANLRNIKQDLNREVIDRLAYLQNKYNDMGDEGLNDKDR